MRPKYVHEPKVGDIVYEPCAPTNPGRVVELKEVDTENVIDIPGTEPIHQKYKANVIVVEWLKPKEGGKRTEAYSGQIAYFKDYIEYHKTRYEKAKEALTKIS